MAGEERFARWSLKERDFDSLTPLEARDLGIKCFFEAQKEAFARAKQGLGISFDARDLITTVEGSIKLTFRDAGEEFERPTGANLSKVVDKLSKKAASWGTPQDIIDYHKSQIQKIISLLRDLTACLPSRKEHLQSGKMQYGLKI